MEINLDNGFAVLCYTQDDYNRLKAMFPEKKWQGTGNAISDYTPCAFYCFRDGQVTYSSQHLYDTGNRPHLPRISLEDLRQAWSNFFTRNTGVPESHRPTRPAPPPPAREVQKDRRPNKCAPTEAVDVAPVVSDGKSTSYYRLKIKRVEDGQEFECEMGDVIASVVGNDFNLGNILKASRRMYEATQGRGKKDVSIRYDANKIGYFADDFAKRQGE